MICLGGNLIQILIMIWLIFVEPTRDEIREELKELGVSEEKIEDLIEKKVIRRNTAGYARDCI